MRSAKLIVFPLVLVAAIAAFAQKPPSAIERDRDLRDEIRKARDANNWESVLQHAKELQQLYNGSPRSHLEVARAELHLNHPAEAWAEVECFLSMGQASDLLTSPMFEGLHHDVSSPMQKNRVPVGIAAKAFELADPGLIAEDLDYDPTTQHFYITSVLEKKIVVVDAKGNARDFAESPDHWPMLALKLDRQRRLLWATEVALDGFSAAPKSDWGKSAVLAFDLETGKLRSRIPGPESSALGDMTLADNGDPIVSDNTGGGIYRVHDAHLDRIDNGDFISPQTATITADGKRLLIPDYVRGIGILDLVTHAVTWLSGENQHALDGIDGLYLTSGNLANGTLLAVQNGASPERVVKFKLDATGSKIVGEEVIERATPTLGDPTHGVIVGNDFYYIANSGWDKLDEHGNLNAGEKLTPAQIMRLPLTSMTAAP